MAFPLSNISGVGIISEDVTDFNALRILISRIINVQGVPFKSKVGNGCSKIKSKCVVWSLDLKNRGCNVLIVVHDLDRNNYNTLKQELSSKLKSSAIDDYFISIPIEEFEAWLIADPNGIKTALNLKRLPKFNGLPETISSPKEKMRDAIFQCSNKEIYYQTAMNKRIAESIDIDKVYKKSPSFKEFVDYIRQHDS